MKRLYPYLIFTFAVTAIGTQFAHANNTFVSASSLTSATSELVMYRNTLSFGNSGYLEKSIDTGKTWTSLTGGGSRAWNVYSHAIAASADGQKVWATTCSSQCIDYVYYSTDGGTTWASSTVLGAGISWQRIASSASGANLILQTGGSTLVSTSSGATWTTVLNGTGGGSVAISPDGATMVSINDFGNDGSIHVSSDSGATWNTVSSVTAKGSSVVVGDSGVMYVGTRDSYIYKSIDYGANWTALKFAGMNNWDDLAMSNDGIHIFALGNVALYYSDDAGRSWYQGGGGGQWRLWYAPDGSKGYYSSGLAYVPVPAIVNQSVTSITATGATLNGVISNDFAFQYSTTVKGFSYGTSTSYGLDASTAGTFTAGAYSQSIGGLTCNSTYFYRAYATNANGSGTASSTYFTTLPCSGGSVANKTRIPTSASTVVQLTGNATGWTSGTPGSPTFTVSGVSGASISSQTVTDATHASITIATGPSTGTLTISDPSNATSTTLNVVLATDVVAANDSRVIYSPGNTYDSGSGVQMMHTGSSAKFVFTGSTLKLDADLSTLIRSGAAFSNYPFINWKIDGGAWQRAQLQPESGVSTQVMTLATGLSSGSHSAQVYYEQGGVEDSWPANSLVKITGWEIEAGKSISTPTYADGLRPKRMMILGDSITRGYSAEADASGVDHTTTGQTYVQDSWGMLFGQKLDAEVGIKAYSGQGYRTIGAGPYVTATFDYVDSQHAQPLPSDLDYFVIAQGANDYQTDITTSVKELLTLSRTQLGPNTKIFLMPSFLSLNDLNVNSEFTTEIQAGLAAYQAAYPSDSKVYYFNIGNIFGAVNQFGPTTYEIEYIHPNRAGHALLATNVANIAEGYAPTIISSIASSTGATSATITWNTDRSADTLVNYGATASYTSSSTYTSAKTLTHSVSITGLSSAQTYHFQIVSVDTASSTSTTTDLTFRTTGSATVPTLATSSPTSLTSSSVTLNATITADGGDASTDVGFNYGLTTSYGSTASTTGSFGAGTFSKSISGLTPSTLYHYRAFATNSAGTATTTDQTFTTSAQSVFIPTLTTSAPSSVTPSALTLNANISATGGEDATQRGFTYGTSANLSTVIATTSLGAFSGTGNFSQNITGLTQNTTYYFRAYAVNSAGTSTGAILSTTTPTQVLLGTPALVQNRSVYPTGKGPTGLSFTSNTTAGNLIVVAVSSYINAGAGDVTIQDSSSNTFVKVSEKDSGNNSKVYLYYAKNIIGGPDTVTVSLTGGYDDLGFHISEWSGLDTTDPFVASSTGANAGALWSTGDLTLTDPAGLIFVGLSDESGGGSPVSPGLGFTVLNEEPVQMSATEYQIINAPGTYSVEMSGNSSPYWAMGSVAFRAQTAIIYPYALTTSAPSSVSTSTLTLNANVSSTGGNNATQHGFAYGTSANLSTVIATTSLGAFSGTGDFTQNLISLTPNTVYYFRAYAVSALGTTTGTILSTTTLQVVIPDTTAPVITGFSIPTTASSLTVPITTFVATDNVAVTSYLLNESISLPSVNDTGWVGTAPTAYVFGTEGTKTLYAWAKDAAGNISASSSGSVTISIPSSGGGSPGGSSGGGGGGGGLLYITPPKVATATLAIKPFVNAGKFQFTRTLSAGSLGLDVKALQEFLNANKYYIATSGLGTPGNETTYFGPATEVALKKFQCAVLSICYGSATTNGYGATGPRTRDVLNGALTPLLVPIVTSAITPMVPIPAVTNMISGTALTSYLSLGVTGQQVKTLQKLLNAKGYTVASYGNGSSGFETTYFGPATDAAVKRFQCATISVCSGSPATNGYGATGPRTRAALTGVAAPTVQPVSSPVKVVAPTKTVTPPVKTTTTPKPIVVPVIDFPSSF
ncbi:MAG: peptidoglycan-binding protein [Candidatus Pacebacteria bacterium]|nr:peptidoglycan-binding protein [Candidatus Paceibacterota bacterium]